MAGGWAGYLLALKNAVTASQLPKSGRVTTLSTKRGVACVVDEEDEWATAMSWHTHRSGKNYYFCHSFDANTHVNLHNIMLPAHEKRGPRTIDVHHIDGDSLNNRRSNLTYAAHSDNVTAGWTLLRRNA